MICIPFSEAVKDGSLKGFSLAHSISNTEGPTFLQPNFYMDHPVSSTASAEVPHLSSAADGGAGEVQSPCGR